MANVRIKGDQIQDNAIPEPKLDPEVRDRLEAGIDWKKSCRCATTGPVVLVGGAPNMVDTVPLALGDRVLVHQQGGALPHIDNGLYTVAIVGSGANGTWFRSPNADSDAEVTSGLTVYVSDGPTYRRKLFNLTTLDPITLGVTPLLFEAIAAGGGSSPIGMPTDGSWEDGYVQNITALTTIADAVDYVNEMMAVLHPLPPRLGLVNAVGDGNIFSASYAGGWESIFKNGKIANPLLAYAITPFVMGALEMLVGTQAAPFTANFRTFNPISGLKLNTVLKAYYTTDGVTWLPLGDDLTLDGTTNAQSSLLGTWDAYGPGGVPGVSPLGVLPNGDLYGYVRFNYAFPALALPQYLDIRLEQVVGASTYTDFLDHYKPVGGVSGGILLDPVTPQPSGTTQILPGAGPGVTRRISGVEYADATYPLGLLVQSNDLCRHTYGPAAGGGVPILTLVESDLGNANELLNPVDFGLGVIPAYNAVVNTILARTVGALPTGTSAATLPANLHHPHGDGLVGNAPLADFCRVCNWPPGDTNVQLNFMDEARRCIQGVGGPPPLTFDFLDIFIFGVPLPGPLAWNPNNDIDYDVPDLGLQVMPSTLPPLVPANNGVLVYPQQNFFNVGIPLDAAGPNYVGRAGNRLYRSFFITPAPQPAGSITLAGLTFADIQEGAPGQKARIELRLPENVAAQWGNLGVPQGIPPFTGLYLGTPNPGDTTIPFAFTPGIHSTNGSSGDSNLYVQVRITFFDLGPGLNLQYLGSLTLGP